MKDNGHLHIVITLLMLAVSVLATLNLLATPVTDAEKTRRARIQQQLLEQELVLLGSVEHVHRISALHQSLDALQISLVEIFTDETLPQGVSNLSFEQLLLPQIESGDDGQSISVLRMVIVMTIKHAGGLLNLLAKLEQHVSAWPREVSACNLQRIPSQELIAKCIVDFYHWSEDPNQLKDQATEASFHSGEIP